MKSELTRRLAFFDSAEIVLSDDEQAPPSEVRLARYGDNEYTHGGKASKFHFRPEDADAVVAEFSTRGRDLVVDYEHQSLKGTEAPAAGWISELQKREDGLYAILREWTDKAVNYFKNREYRYFSPVLKFSRTQKTVSGVHSVALTNHPALHYAPAAFADDDADHEEFENEVKDMDKLLEMLGLVALSEDDDRNEKIEEAVQGLLDSKAAQDEFLALHEVENLEAITDKINSMVPAEEKAELEQSLKAQAAEKVVELALSEGKICEAQKDKAMALAMSDIDTFNALYENAPVIVPLNEDTDPEPSEMPEVRELTDEERKVAKLTGIAEEELRAELAKKEKQ